MVDVAHHGHDGRAGPLVGVLLLVLLLEVAGQQLRFLLLARVDQAYLAPISAAKSSIMSSVNDWVAMTISPWSMRKRTMSPALRFSLGPRSRAVDPRSTMTSPSGTGAVEGW